MNTSEGSQAQGVTIADVGRRAGVSISTVSRVINDSAPVNSETAGRVRKAIEELGFVPQTAARNLANRKTQTLGLLLPGIGGDFFSLMLRGVEEAASEYGYDLLIASQRAYTELSRPPLGTHNTDGLLIFTGDLDALNLQAVLNINFPMVLLYQSAPNHISIPCVTIENKLGSDQLVSHLIEVHGCKRIGFLRGPVGNEDSAWRERGYRDALEKHGIPFDPALVAEGDYTEETSSQAVADWLRSGIKMDAIFGGSDEGAIGAMQALGLAHVKVPDEIKVVGFDDLSMARYMVPPLTTVRAPTVEVGRIAVKQLLRIIDNEHVETLTLLPTELVIRQSCGCP